MPSAHKYFVKNLHEVEILLKILGASSRTKFWEKREFPLLPWEFP